MHTLQDVAEYWRQVLDSVDKSTARALLPQIDVDEVGALGGRLEHVARCPR